MVRAKVMLVMIMAPYKCVLVPYGAELVHVHSCLLVMVLSVVTVVQGVLGSMHYNVI